MKSPFSKFIQCSLILIGSSLAYGADPARVEASSTTTTVPATEYRLHPDDVIEVRIYGEDDLTSKARLNENGKVILPLLDALDLRGATIQQANERIRDAYKKDYLINPITTVSILEYGNSKVSVMGQVRNPGVYQFPNNGKLNLLQAIALAGGYTRIGEPSRVTIKRTLDGQTTVVRLDAKAMATKEKSAIIEVCPDDVVNVGETIF
jgi:polysaccharide export outer membrane protein